MGELLLYNGTIHTIDPLLPSPQAVLVKEDRISYVGGEAEARRRADSSAVLIDLGGRTLIPGFNDNHTHLIALGENLSRPDLRGMDQEQIVAVLKEQYAEAKAGETLYAWGWDYPSCPRPHRRVLDVAFPDNPVVLIQFSGHGIWVNSQVLHKQRIGPGTPDPPGGEIERDEQGLPTGILRESAAMPIHRSRFMKMLLNKNLQREMLNRALTVLRKAGITSIQDNTWFHTTVGLLNRYRKQDLLTARVSCWFHGMMPGFTAPMRLKSFDDTWVRRGLWKYFLDGTFSTRTAWLLEPYAAEGTYAEQPSNYGISTGVKEKVKRYLGLSLRKGRQAAFHAIGDRTIREFLDSVEQYSRSYPRLAELRLRIEHAQLIDPADMARLAELGILVAAQPSALGTPEKDLDLLGEQRARRAYPYRSLLDAGVQLSFGSDMPGETSFDPLMGIHYTVNRSGSEHISAAEALRCYTLGSAYAEFQEDRKGSLRAGKLADLVVLSQDPLSVRPEMIKDIEVEMTIVGGRIVYSKA
jgi:predicted amidohydrolase YtcJ